MGKQLYSEAQKIEYVVNCKRSGMSITDFAGKNGISRQNLYNWQKIYADEVQKELDNKDDNLKLVDVLVKELIEVKYNDQNAKTTLLMNIARLKYNTQEPSVALVDSVKENIKLKYPPKKDLLPLLVKEYVRLKYY
ncbi:MAG: transposase [Victivallales bacterium]|nr:transposase [Victivallales bacterium]